MKRARSVRNRNRPLQGRHVRLRTKAPAVPRGNANRTEPVTSTIESNPRAARRSPSFQTAQAPGLRASCKNTKKSGAPEGRPGPGHNLAATSTWGLVYGVWEMVFLAPLRHGADLLRLASRGSLGKPLQFKVVEVPGIGNLNQSLSGM